MGVTPRGRAGGLELDGGFAAGFVLDGLEEPVLPEGAEGRPPSWGKRPFSWENFRDIPPVLVCRLIKKT